ncbi:hypothetical protein M5K25_016669 [Dendrobium thyrsiflorum]|uniref:Uncharacterized protein n=1 Tax=Dendrobium thyrsiflorum TaxID=117978 RepID=A0ABD0UKA7_DENTH
MEPFQREDSGGRYGERHEYGGQEQRGANWERREGNYGRQGADFEGRRGDFEGGHGFRTFWQGLTNMGYRVRSCDKVGNQAIRDASIKVFYFSLMLSPVVSVWDCTIRKIMYSFRPEWV